MAFPPYAAPVAIGLAGLAAILGYLVFKKKLPLPTAAIAAPGGAGKTTQKKASGGGGGGGGGGSAASKTKKNWKVVGYNAGLAMGKADKASGDPFFIVPTRVAAGSPAMPVQTDAASVRMFPSLGEMAVAIGLWTQGYSDGYPVGYGKLGSKAPKYALEEEEGGGAEEMSLVPEETTTETEATTEESTDSDSLVGGVRVGQTMRLYHHAHRPDGAWGPQRHVLAHARRGAFSRPSSRMESVERPSSQMESVERPSSQMESAERPAPSSAVENRPPPPPISPPSSPTSSAIAIPTSQSSGPSATSATPATEMPWPWRGPSDGGHLRYL